MLWLLLNQAELLYLSLPTGKEVFRRLPLRLRPSIQWESECQSSSKECSQGFDVVLQAYNQNSFPAKSCPNHKDSACQIKQKQHAVCIFSSAHTGGGEWRFSTVKIHPQTF